MLSFRLLPVYALSTSAFFIDDLPNTIPQCAQLNIAWSQPTPGSPFNITLLPFISQPLNITITPSPSQESGIFSTSLPFPSGTSFLLSADNITSNIITVTPSSNSSCLPFSPKFSPYFIRSKPVNCIPTLFNMSCLAANCSNAPQIQGYVPNGQGPFTVATVGPPASWFISVTTETQVLLQLSQIIRGKRFIGTSELLTIGGSSAIPDCHTFVFFQSSNITEQQSLPTKRSQPSSLTARTIIGILIGSSVGFVALLWLIFFLRRRIRGRRQQSSSIGLEGGTRTTNTRDFVLDSEFAATFSSSVFPSSRGTITSKGFEKSPQNPLFQSTRSTIPLSLSLDRAETRIPSVAPLYIPTKPPPTKVPSHIPMDVVPESQDLETRSIYQGNLSPSLLPDWASVGTTNTANPKRQTRESGRVV